jgi:GNAT superfamily N-acetyltransferase
MTACPCTIRLARSDDVPAIYLLKWQMALAERAADTLRASEADWQRDMFGPRPRFLGLLAETGGIPVGMATLVERYYPAWAGPLFALDSVFVTPEHRGRGVGKALLAGVAAEALRRGTTFLELTVRTKNPARRLYERVGFEPVRGAMMYVLAGNALTALAQTLEAIGYAISA